MFSALQFCFKVQIFSPTSLGGYFHVLETRNFFQCPLINIPMKNVLSLATIKAYALCPYTSAHSIKWYNNHHIYSCQNPRHEVLRSPRQLNFVQ
jgi:hypothetical protein